MRTRRHIHTIITVLVTLSMILTSVTPALAAPALALPDASVTAAPALQATDTGLYRTTVHLAGPSDQQRFARLSLVQLDAGADWATVLVDGTQLETLARLGFTPQNTEAARTLVETARAQTPWLAASMAPLLELAAAQQADVSAASADAVNALHAGMAALPAEARAALADTPSLDDDGDGLTNLEETWWCTDPLNPNSDGDAQGYTDGQEVAALLDFTRPRQERWNYGPPFGPPAAWPDFNNQDGNPNTPACNDGDWDTIPDYAEAYIVGTRVGTQDSENTDGDKFDDGQELFGLTYCPGGPDSCNWGNYPREQDFTFITSGMPSWIRPPGDSPFVAAYPVIDFLVDPATVTVTAKEIRTVERTITQGEEIANGFARTEGSSTAVGTIDTNTHNTWQEHSSSEGGIEPASIHSVEEQHSRTNMLASSSSAVASTMRTTPTQPLNQTDIEEIKRDAEGQANAVRAASAAILHTDFLVDDIRGDGSWALLNLVSYPLESSPDTHMVVPQVVLAIAHKDHDDGWEISFEGTDEYDQLIGALPDSVLSDAGKYVLQSSTDAAKLSSANTAYEVPGLPWEQGTSWRFNQGPHAPENAWDFGTPLVNGESNHPSMVFPADDGLVIQRKETCMAVRRSGDGLILWYQHIQKRDVSTWSIGDYVNTSRPLGMTTIENGCGGYSTGHHVHFFLNAPAPPTGTVPSWGTAFDPEGSSLNGWLVKGNTLEKDGVVKIGGSYSNINHSGNRQASGDVCWAPSITDADVQSESQAVTARSRAAEFIEWIGKSIRGLFRNEGNNSNAVSVAAAQLAADVSSSVLNYSDLRTSGACDSGLPHDDGQFGIGGGSSGLTYQGTGGGSFTALRVWSETTTNGEGWSTSHSELRTETEYSEITRSQTNTLVSSEAWATATTVDPTDAGTLSFNYNLRNVGSDFAVNLANIQINILIGDLPAITWYAPPANDIEPGKAKGPFSGGPIVLTLAQLAAIDNGEPIRVVLANYDYNDNLYDANAWGRGVLFHVDDGVADGDESIDTYLVTTQLMQNETYQDTLARYFDVTTFQGLPDDERNGTITSIRTPEYDALGEITQWIDRPVGENAWWELSISRGGETDGVKHFRDMPAKPKTDVYLRYVQDSDGDGYSDRAEIDGRSDPLNPDIHPQPLLVAAKHTVVDGNQAQVQLALDNLGNFDASSVEVWAIEPDDSITIGDNLIGGGGRVRAGRRVVLGARIGAPDLANWNESDAKPYPSGQFEGTQPVTYQFRADANGNVGSTPGLTISWSDNGGGTWTPLAVGDGYAPVTSFSLSHGVQIAFSAGYIHQGDTFSFATALPIDTFAYTINRQPYTEPLIVVSYNDAQGNHKFVSDVEVDPIQADLLPFVSRMQRGFRMDVMGETEVQPGANTAHLIFNNPAATTIVGGNIYVEFATPDGTVVKEYVLSDLTFSPGPNVATLQWNTGDFNPPYDPAQDYHILAFATDRRGTIFENTVKALTNVGKDRLPRAALSDTTWDFGTAQQGTLLSHDFALANVGQADMMAYVGDAPGLTVSTSSTAIVAAADVVNYTVQLYTGDLPLGAYETRIPVRTSDPQHPHAELVIRGEVTAGVGDTPVGPVVRPLDVAVTVTGNQGEWVQFAHSLGPDPDTLHPVKVWDESYESFLGIGKYATPFSAGTASYDMFGDGRDGVMPSSGNLNNNNGVGVAIVNSGSQGTYTINVTDAYAGWRMNAGDAVLIHQSQGTNAGCWEINKAAADYAGGTANIQLTKPLQCNYYAGGNNHAQVQRVPQYSTCNVTGTVTPLYGWNGSTGGVLAVMCSGTLNVQGVVSSDGGNGATGTEGSPSGGSGAGFRGGRADAVNNDNYGGGDAGEGHIGPGSWHGDGTPNGNGGGAGDGLPSRGNYGTGGGGGNGSAGTASTSGGIGYGGSVYGNAALASMVFGGGGGGSNDNPGNSVGGGGGGGGIIVLQAAEIVVSGTIHVNGGKAGGNKWAGGGGAGGSILLRGKAVTVGSSKVSAVGGAAHHSGGAGGNGRIRIEYCDSASGVTNPLPSTQKLNCFAVDQAIEPTNGRLNLPASGTNTYQIQYGRKLNWDASANQVTTLRVPAGLFTSVTLQAMVSDLPSNAAFTLDIGNTGTNSWSGTVSNNSENTSPNLAPFFNAYWASHGAPTAGMLDVPVRVTLDRAGQVLLTNLQVVPTGDKTRYLRLPVLPQSYSDVTATFTVADGPGPLVVGVDVGADGTVDWTYSSSPAYPAQLTTGALADALNAYLTGRTGMVDVPLRIYASPLLPVGLVGFQASTATGPDVTITALNPAIDSTTEGNRVALTAQIANHGAGASGPLTLALFASAPERPERYIGSAFVSGVPGNGSTQAMLDWDTLGFTGPTTVRAVVDRYNRISEDNETNNEATTTVTLLTRPDLMMPAITLSDDEPLYGGTVELSVALQNHGQTAAGASVLAFYDGSPENGGLVCQEAPIVAGNGVTDVHCNWTPPAPGHYRLFAVSDRDSAVNEYDEGNNSVWQDVYVGLASPVALNSGTPSDVAYATAGGYGVVDTGIADVTANCGAAPHQTYRLDPSGQVTYRFDHLQPGHFYHLDITMFECAATGRQQRVYVDGNLIAGPVDLGDGEMHQLSLRLDPALYQDRSITVTVEDPGIDGAVVSQVNLVDVDYRYVDAGGSNDVEYSAARGYGWLNGAASTSFGALPYQSVRVNQVGDRVLYRFDNLNSSQAYKLNFTFWQPSGTERIQKVEIDGMDSGLTVDTGDYTVQRVSVTVPMAAVADGTIDVAIVRQNAATGAMVNEIALEPETIAAPSTCSAQETPTSMIVYGSVTISGQPAPVGSTIRAIDPRGNTVGCMTVVEAGIYTFMFIYGEDSTANPPLPGMRAGESIRFEVNGLTALASQATVWQANLQVRIDLDARSLDTQQIPLKPNWNQISTHIEPVPASVRQALESIDGLYDRVLGNGVLFAPSLEDRFNSLTEMHCGTSYYLRSTAPTTTYLVVEGTRCPVNMPIELDIGWEPLGYLPDVSIPVAEALATIAGKYDRVITLGKALDTNLPQFSNLTHLEPGVGYLIHMLEPGTLVYPEAPAQVAAVAETAVVDAGLCRNVTPTPYTTLLYGRILINGQPAPAGVRVQALTPDGAVAGCTLTHGDGAFGLMHVYGADGDDASGLAAATPGFRHGEAIRLRVAGVEVQSAPTPAWQDDRTPHQVDVSIDALDFFKMYLPAIVRGMEVEESNESLQVVATDEPSPIENRAAGVSESQSFLPIISPEQTSQSTVVPVAVEPHEVAAEHQSTK